MTEPENGLTAEEIKRAQDEELDSWYDDDESDEGYSDEGAVAEEEDLPEPDTSPVARESGDSPTNEVRSDDAGTPASTDGNRHESAGHGADDYEWIAALAPEVQKKVQDLVHSERSQRGRVAAYRSRLDKVEAEQAARALSPVSPAAPQGASGQAKAFEDMSDDELREFQEEFPSVAKGIEKMLEKRLEKERRELIEPLRQERRAEQILKEKEVLRREADVIFNTAETGVDLDTVLQSPRWREWMSQQPKEYQRFAVSSQSAEVAAKVLRDFARYAEDEITARLPVESATPVNSKADEVAARRQQARQGTGPRSRTAAIASDNTSGGSYEDYFNEAVERAEGNR